MKAFFNSNLKICQYYKVMMIVNSGSQIKYKPVISAQSSHLLSQKYMNTVCVDKL